MNILNIAAYKFVSLLNDELTSLKETLLTKADALNIKGTILLSPEGINLFLAGPLDFVKHYQAFLADFKAFGDLDYKESLSEDVPFKRMLVKLKKQIIVMDTDIDPQQDKAPYLAPEEFKQWYEQGRDMVVLDTRNHYEVAAGTFDQALDLAIEHFRDFENIVELLPEDLKEKPIVTFCTGGIRCEKAAPLLRKKGFKQVYQLEGGILNYFEKVGGEHYHGDCFVFDNRVTVDSHLNTAFQGQCYACQQKSANDARIKSCPDCQHLQDSRVDY